VPVTIPNFAFFLPSDVGFQGWALGKFHILPGEAVASFLWLHEDVDSLTRDCDVACSSEVDDSF
jgi:hypothetical protein